MALIVNSMLAQEVAAGSTAAVLASNLNNTLAPGLAKYVYCANVNTWIAQGIAEVAFTVSDVTFVFNAPNHRLRTGMPVQAVNVGGSLPTGVSADTTYWAQIIDANNFYLYTSQADAMGTPGGATGQVQPSSAGSGTNSVTTVATAGAGSLYVPASTQVIIDGAYGAQVSVIDDGTAGKASIAPVVNVV